MKRVDLIQAMTKAGYVLIQHGGKHEWNQNPVTGVCQPVPRHREINELLAEQILKMLTGG